ncbi:hypothetical protein HMPREF0541_03023 [Lacticaseibacillus rhamnosus ATCC 21052]|nr:hypothetical protein HMPREF0541_03023 [Lacticaseibacillus rhamnosus ATCC 21052]
MANVKRTRSQKLLPQLLSKRLSYKIKEIFDNGISIKQIVDESHEDRYKQIILTS